MGLRHPERGIIGIDKAQCERACLMDTTCVGSEMNVGAFFGINMCELTEINDFIPKQFGEISAIVFRCPRKYRNITASLLLDAANICLFLSNFESTLN